MIKNQWYAILPSKGVKEGKLLAVKRLNLKLVLFRTSKNEIACVADKCSHRGVALSKGKIKGDCIQCPFHGIEFNKDGKCEFIPANGISSKEDLTRFNIKSYLVREEHGIIFFWYGDNELATEKIPFFTQHINDSDVYSEVSDLWKTHYSRAIENQLDVVHVPFVHYDSIGRGNKTLVNGPKTEFKNGVIKISPSNEFDYGQKQKEESDCVTRDDMYLTFMFPNMWVNKINDKMKIFIYFAPVDNKNTILYIRFYSTISKIKLVNSTIAFLGKFANLHIERQDKRIVVTQIPKASSYKSKEKLIKGDRPIILYRKIRNELQNGKGNIVQD